MILTKEFAEKVLINSHVLELQDVKCCLKSWRDEFGLQVPKLNSKGIDIWLFFEDLVDSCRDYLASLDPKTASKACLTKLFSKQLKNVGEKSRKSLLTKLA